MIWRKSVLIVAVVLLTFIVVSSAQWGPYETEIDDAYAAAENELKTTEKVAAARAGPASGAERKDFMFSRPSADAVEMGEEAELMCRTFDYYRLKSKKGAKEVMDNTQFQSAWKKKFEPRCSKFHKPLKCDKKALYRRADGRCNNLKHPFWGAELTPQVRLLPPTYDNYFGSPRQTSVLGGDLPSTRKISNILFTSKKTPPKNKHRTIMLTQWGQFVDHDFTRTPIFTYSGGSPIDCCSGRLPRRPDVCFPITIPDDDPYFCQFNKTCMNFVRSLPAMDLTCGLHHREQINEITSFIDASNVYGSNEKETWMLRTGYNGLLKTRPYNLLPKGPPDTCVLSFPAEDFCLKAGDIRSNEVPSLGWIHTLFVREHNRIAKILKGMHDKWDDEKIFQETRRIIAAFMQHIHYNEFLDALLNDDTMKKYKLRSKPHGYNDVYKDTVNPGTINSVSTAAFRFGHSLVRDHQATMDKTYSYYTSQQPLKTTFFDPHMILVNHGMGLDGFARWIVHDKGSLTDRLFVNGLRNHLFETSPGDSMDLTALNLQRGRDHGLPCYNEWREYCGLPRAASFKELKTHDRRSRKLLKKAYRHVDDIDLFAGAMSEKLLPNSFLGPTFTCLIGEQFRNLKEGDRFWYETPAERICFTPDQLAEIKKVTMARIICNNYDVDTIQPNVFKSHKKKTNKRVPCSDIPYVDLWNW